MTGHELLHESQTPLLFPHYMTNHFLRDINHELVSSIDEAPSSLSMIFIGYDSNLRLLQTNIKKRNTLPPLLDIEDVFGQTDVERLWEQEDQAAAEDPSSSKDQRRQKKPDVLQQHDHRSQRAADPADTRGVAQTALPVQQQLQV